MPSSRLVAGNPPADLGRGGCPGLHGQRRWQPAFNGEAVERVQNLHVCFFWGVNHGESS